MNFPGSQLSLSNLDLRTPEDQSARAAGLTNIGAIFDNMPETDMGFLTGNRIELAAERRAFESKLANDLEIEGKVNDANLEIYKDQLMAQRGLAQDAADAENRSNMGALGGAAAGGALLASGVVGPLAIPIGMAGGKFLSGLFG